MSMSGGELDKEMGEGDPEGVKSGCRNTVLTESRIQTGNCK